MCSRNPFIQKDPKALTRLLREITCTTTLRVAMLQHYPDVCDERNVLSQ